MNFVQKFIRRFTARGKALALVNRGMACAKRNESDNAIKHYNAAIQMPNSPRDVIAMAMFNRAMVYTTIGQQDKATQDLNAVLNMPESLGNIKKSAKDKLVRMQRKQEREDAPRNSDEQQAPDRPGDA